MSLTGLAKRFALDRRESFDASWKSPLEAQENLLRGVIERNKETWFGKKHGFGKIRNFDDLHKHVPLMTWRDYDHLVDRVIAGERNLLFVEQVKWLIQSTGTTGKPKLLPVGDTYLNNLAESAARLVLFYIAEDPDTNAKVLEGKVLGFATSSVLREIRINDATVPVGYIDGVAQQLGGGSLGEGITLPTQDVINSTDWDARYYGTAKQAVGEDVRVFGGAVTLVINLATKISKEYPKRLLKDLQSTSVVSKIKGAMDGGEINIRKLWPNLALVLHSLANPTPYRTALHNIFGDVPDREGYGNSEVGMVMGQLNGGEAMSPYIDLFVMEAVRQDDFERNGSDAERMPFSEAKPHSDYFPVFTVDNGLYSYLLDDVLRCVSKTGGIPKFEVVGRAEAMFNLAGEKLKELELSTAVNNAAIANNLTIGDYTVSATYGSTPGYVFAVEFTRVPDQAKAKSFLKAINEELKRMDELYRDLADGLTPPRLLVLPDGTLTRFEERTLKTPERRLKPKHIDKEGKLLDALKTMGVTPVATYKL